MGPFACVFVISGWRIFQMVSIFYLALSSAALLVVGRWGGFSYHIYPDMYITDLIWPILVLFIFTSFVSNWFSFRQNLEDSAPLSRVTLSIFFVQNFIGGGSKVVGGFYFTTNFCAICWGFSFAQSSWWSPLLFTGCWYPPNILAEFWWDSCPLYSLHYRVSKVLGRTDSQLRALPWGVFSLPSFFGALWHIKVWWYSFLLSCRIFL